MGFLKHNVPLKLLSLAISLVLWLYVQSSRPQVAQQTFQFDLKIINLDRQNLIVTSLATQVVRIQASGTPEELKKLKGKEFSAYIDLLDAKTGLQEYTVKPNLPTDAKLDWERPPTVFVNIEALAHDYKKVTVIQDESLAPSGFALGEPTIEPVMVKVEGAQSKVKEVVQCRALLMGVDRIKPGMEVRVPVELLDAGGKVVTLVSADPKEVVIRPTLIPVLPRHAVLVTPTWKGQPAFGYRIVRYTLTPNQVELTGDHRLLSRISTVETKPIDIEGLKQSATLETNLVLPSGSSTKDLKKVRVRIEVEKLPEPVGALPGEGGP